MYRDLHVRLMFLIHLFYLLAVFVPSERIYRLCYVGCCVASCIVDVCEYSASHVRIIHCSVCTSHSVCLLFLFLCCLFSADVISPPPPQQDITATFGAEEVCALPPPPPPPPLRCCSVSDAAILNTLLSASWHAVVWLLIRVHRLNHPAG